MKHCVMSQVGGMVLGASSRADKSYGPGDKLGDNQGEKQATTAMSGCKVCALPDGIGFPNPGGEVIIELGLLPDPVMVHK